MDEKLENILKIASISMGIIFIIAFLVGGVIFKLNIGGLVAFFIIILALIFGFFISKTLTNLV